MPKRLDHPDDRRRLEAFVQALFSSSSEEQVRKDLADLTVPIPYRVRVKVLYGRAPLANLVAEPSRGPERLRRTSDAGPGFHLSGEVGTRHRRTLGVHFGVLGTEHPRVGVVASVCTGDQWRFLTKWIARQYPRLVPVYLSQSELIEGVKTLRDESQAFSIRVREITAREPLERRGRASDKAVREWTDEDLQEVLAHVMDRHQVLTNMKLGFHKRIGSEVDISPSVVAKIARDGVVEISGRFGLAWGTAVQHVAAVGAKKLQFYSRRGLRDRQYSSAPLEIRFNTPVFADLTEVRRLVASLTDYPHSMHSVQHGNPYIHMQVADVYDGSSFDVWAVSDRSLVLMPRLKASEAAFERLIHYVFESFREGSVVEYVDA